VLAEELHLVTLELRAGASKEKALRNFALRTGVEEVDSLVAMLVQSERFGTSIADSLRVHSESLRTKRRLRAEEAAAKIPVKLTFPLIVGIFPAMLIVLAGPAIIRIARVLLPTLAGH
jgi:tight adherence protein C